MAVNPDHDPPDPELVREIDWERVDHPEHGERVRIPVERTGGEVLQAAYAEPVLEGLEAGDGFEAIVDRLHEWDPERFPPDKARRRAGRFLFSLRMTGYVDLPYDPPTDVFAGRYEVQEELGRGGVGVVWRCRDRRTGEDVAVKRAWDYFLPLDEAEDEVRHELGVLRDLDVGPAPGIPSLRGTFQARDRTHLVRAVVDGDPLDEGVEGPAQAAGRAADVAETLAHVHDRGYLLLDVTPRNFLQDERPVLVDPGLAREMEGALVQLEAAVGAKGYRAPEVREDHRAGPAADVYGLGCLTFALAAGRRPSRAWGGEEMAVELDHGGLAEAVAALCREDPEARPGLAEARDRLRKLAGSDP